MKLGDLIKNLEVKKTIGNLEVEVLDVKTNSNAVTKGSIFVCLSGGNHDGHDFAVEAEKYGAVAIITERKLDVFITQIIVDDTRKALSIVAGNFYENAHKKLKIVGITGTNGKTTTSYLITSILMNSGIKCGIIGTLGIYYSGKYIEADLTTPDPVLLHKTFYEMYRDGVEVVVMEVSAHAIYLKKVHGIEFEVGVFTNCTQDHLDFFGNMDKYAETKKAFFKTNTFKHVVTNIDDKTGLEILKKTKNSTSYGLINPSEIFALDVEKGKNGLKFIMNLFDEVYKVKTSLLGEYNVYNCLASSIVAYFLGVKAKNIITGIENLKGVSGRLEKVYDKDFSVYVDYAHTPDGLSKTLSALKSVCSGKLICVFGCGGNRDKEKRAIMGEISGELADFTVITSDNPRFEEPIEIIWQIEKGILKKSENYVIVEDRKQAINYALNYAKKGDIVLIAGKGSEKYQEVFGIKRFYNDRDVVEEVLE